MHIEERTLDVSKKDGRSGQIKPVILRKGEQNQTQIKINLTSDGEPYSIGNLTPKFCAVLPNKKYVRDTSHVTKSTNYVTYTVQSDLTSADGDIRVAYIELQSSGNSLTSDTLPIIVLENTDLTTEQAQQYQDQIEALVKDLENSINKANNAASNASSAATSANNAASSANTAKTNAQNAANSANTAANEANTAKNNADKATSAANTAAEAANTAKQAVDDAMGKFTTITDSEVKYQVGTSGTTPPTGKWLTEPPTVPQGQYLWVRNTTSYNKGNPTIAYAVAFQGRDGSFAGDERIEALEEKVESINDFTTGINLIRGSMNWKTGTVFSESFPSQSVYIDGFYTNPSHLSSGLVSFVKDEDGFTCEKISQKSNPEFVGAYSNAIPIDEFKTGDYLTVFYEMKLEDEVYTDTEILANIGFYKDKSTVSNGSYNPDIRVTQSAVVFKRPNFHLLNEWQLVVFHIPINMASTEGVVVCVRLQMHAIGTVYFRKLDCCAGKIVNPVYSIAPVDLTLEPVNDITTGINLALKTRDMTLGVQPTQFTSRADGFTIAGYAENYIEIDEYGFGNVIINNPSSDRDNYCNSSKILNVKEKDMFTVSYEVKIENNGTNILDQNISTCFLCDDQGAFTEISYALTSTEKEKLTNGDWVKIIHRFTISNSRTKWMFYRLRNLKVGALRFRKLNVVRGFIVNPEWTASPFDVVQVSQFSKPKRYDVMNKITPADGVTISRAILSVSHEINAQLYLEVKFNSVHAAGSQFDLCTLDSSILPELSSCCVLGQAAFGFISSGDNKVRLGALLQVASGVNYSMFSTYFLANTFSG